MDGRITSLDKHSDVSLVKIEDSILSNSKLVTSGLELKNVLIRNSDIKCDITGIPSYDPEYGSTVPTIKFQNSLATNVTLETYSFAWQETDQLLVQGVEKGPFDLAIKFKKDCEIYDVYTLVNTFEGDPSFEVYRAFLRTAQDGEKYISSALNGNFVSIISSNGIRSNFNKIDSINIVESRFGESGVLAPAMPNAIPPVPERIVPAYMNGGPYIATDLITTTENYAGVKISTTNLPSYNEEKWFGYWNTLGSISSPNISLGGVTNRGTIAGDRIILMGGVPVSGASVFNFGTIKMNKFFNGATVSEDGGDIEGDQIRVFPGGTIILGSGTYTTNISSGQLFPSQFNIN
jgi:hypothetical protein